jgi:hypothetical protein
LNARLTSIQSQTGVRGDGERVFGANPITVPIPAMVKDPSSHRRSTDRSEGIETDSLITINREALRRQGHTPAVGDRVGFKLNHLVAMPESGDVVSIKSLGNDTIVELAIEARMDNGQDADQGGAAS